MPSAQLACATLLLFAGCIYAQTAPPPAPPPAAPAPTAPPQFTITLNTGEVLKGALATAPDADPIVLEHAVFGKLTLARALVKSIEPAAAAAPPAPAPPAQPPAAATPPTPTPAPAPTPPPPAAPPATPAPAAPPPPPPPPAAAEIGLFDKWTGTVEAGLNSLSGNTDRLSFRFGLGLRRETPDTVTVVNSTYNTSRDNNGLSEDRARLDLRNDWIQKTGSGWRYFVASSDEYDRFQPWDWRVSVSGGLGYDLVKEKTLTVIGRAGFGGSREFGSSIDTVHAEVTPGMDLEWRIDERSKITAGLDYYRDLDNFDIYRFVARAAYDILLDPKSNLSLRLGIEDRYDETSISPRDKNDVEVFSALVFKF